MVHSLPQSGIRILAQPFKLGNQVIYKRRIATLALCNEILIHAK